MKRASLGIAYMLLLAGVLCSARHAHAQILLADDDEYGVPFAEPLMVEASGVLDNDTLDGEPAGENGATAELVSDVTYGTLTLNSDGSFSYAPGATFDGLDAFTYRAVFGAVASEATVTLTACAGGPPRFVCWKEAAYLTKAAELGYGILREGFEDDAVWGSARSPNTAPSVVSNTVQWTTNHPATNEITTGSGPARTGQWGVFDPEHGVATGTPAQCDIDVPPPECLYHDGFSGVRQAGLGALHGVGGYITGFTGANVAAVLGGATQVDLGQLPDSGHHFFGVIDASAAGFAAFEFREVDGKVGQQLLIFGDDFSFAVADPGSIPALSVHGLVGLGVLLAIAAARRARFCRAK